MSNLFSVLFFAINGQSQSKLAHAIRYLIAGGAVFLFDVLVFFLFFDIFENSVATANIISKSLGATLGYFLHYYYTFSWGSKKHSKQKVVEYILLAFANTALSTFFIFILVSVENWPAIPCKIIVDAFVILLAFVISRSVIFKKEL
ncbi:GtrA family protein [Colwellia piezophila]|uniref:GtrA family protein n=1 Tax=Colwellia piezophila TaxID=211668 RepID=UPI000372213F|nr:GtrA family protein [Colwellia piezophila]